jgi:hypothetical protein
MSSKLIGYHIISLRVKHGLNFTSAVYGSLQTFFRSMRSRTLGIGLLEIICSLSLWISGWARGMLFTNSLFSLTPVPVAFESDKSSRPGSLKPLIWCCDTGI